MFIVPIGKMLFVGTSLILAIVLIRRAIQNSKGRDDS